MNLNWLENIWILFAGKANEEEKKRSVPIVAGSHSHTF